MLLHLGRRRFNLDGNNPPVSRVNLDFRNIFGTRFRGKCSRGDRACGFDLPSRGRQTSLSSSDFGRPNKRPAAHPDLVERVGGALLATPDALWTFSRAWFDHPPRAKREQPRPPSLRYGAPVSQVQFGRWKCRDVGFKVAKPEISAR